MVLKYFFILLKKFGYGFKRAMAGLFIMSVIGGFLELLGIAMIFPVMFILTSSDSAGGKIILNYCSKFFPNTPELKIAFILSLIMIGVFIFKNIFMMAYIKIQNDFAAKWSIHVNKDVTSKLLSAPYSETLELTYGDKDTLLSCIVREISFDFVLRSIILFANGVVALCIVCLLFYKFTLPAFLSTLFIIVWAFFENAYFKNKARKFGDIEVDLLNTLAQAVNFIIKSQKEIIISNKQEFFTRYLNTASKEIAENNSKKITYGNFPLYVTEMGVIFAFLIMIVSIVYGQADSKEAILASLAIIGLIILRLVPQLNKVLISMYAINISKQKVIWFLDKYDEISKYGHEVYDTENEVDFQKTLSLQNVDFHYKNGKGIENINLTVNKGEFVGIIGASGAGKTTLADVLSGLFIPEKGHLFVDDKEIDKSMLQSYRNLISFLPQESVFMDNTVMNNVIWGKDKIDMKRASEALKMAGLDIDIYSDMNLSLGQKKRVALARCYYNDFEVLILDEATSALDSETEKLVMENILKFKGEKTIIAIAHRLSTLKECDKIVYLKGGKIADTGTFDEIRARNEEVEQMIRFSSLI